MRPVFFNMALTIFGIVFCAVNISGCHHARRILDPGSHESEIHLPGVHGTAGNPWSYTHKIRGDILMARGETDEAVKAYQSAATGDPADAWIQINFAEALLRKGDLERAKVHVSRAIMIEPACGRAWTVAAKLYLQRGDRKKAFEAARYGSRVDRTDTSALNWMGDQLAESRKKSDWKQALSYYQAALVRSRTNPDLYLAAGTVALRLSYAHLAERYLLRYMMMYGENTDAVLESAGTFAKTGKTDAAANLYEIMLQRNPVDDHIREQLVPLYLKSGKNVAAVRMTLSFHLAPTTPESVIERTTWLQTADAPWEAREMILENFSGAPVHPRIRYQLAKIEWLLRRDEVALALLNFPGDIPEDLVEKVGSLRKEIEGE